ncbi:hypothetical protein GGR57DRAFT_487138 [Xylariaceae sp. FL1272]|nr:hypothetical protein GGR57DRAFT_487138 [Xylariaceae sp. FL1272]
MALKVGFLIVALGASGVFCESKVPAVGERNVVQRYSDTSFSLPHEHVFYPNSQINVSWDDPELMRRLWSGRSDTTKKDSMPSPTEKNPFRKRTVPRVLGTLWKIPSCLGCAEARNTVGKGTIGMLTEAYLETVLIKSDRELKDTCLFYTSLTGDSEMLANLGPWYRGRREGGLSLPARDYSCSNGLTTIWDAFSGGTDTEAVGEDPKLWNYWVVEKPDTWLSDGLVKTQPFVYENEPDVAKYFENMSGAFAKHCGGIVRVMTFQPRNLGKYGKIWGMIELVRLRDNIKKPGSVMPTNLISINAINPTEQFNLDFQTLDVIKTVTKDDPMYFDPARFERRDTCGQNVNYEPPEEDWFG